MKIKDNLNLNGYILQNFCIDNYDSLDGINDKNRGRAVFLTGNGTNAGYGHVNVYDGTSFKALAYVDEIANNEDFLALKNKVDAFLDGGVDADNVLENLAEVQKFLDNYSGATSLSQILDTKLDKTGGTISGSTVIPLLVDTSASVVGINLRKSNADKLQLGWDASSGVFLYSYASGKLLGIKDDGTPYFNDGTKANTILTSAGGTIDGNLFIGAENNTAYKYIRIWRNNKKVELASAGDTAILSFNGVGFAFNETQALWSGNTLLHSGNVGEYAVKTDGSNEMKDVLFLNFSNPRIAFKSGDNTHGSFGYFSDGLKWYSSAENAYHTIAFTDSIVDKAKALVDGNGNNVFAVNSSGQPYVVNDQKLITSQRGIGDNADRWRLQTCGNVGDLVSWPGVELYSTNGVVLSVGGKGLLLNSSGNVTIGGSDLATTTYKLYVSGSVGGVKKIHFEDNTSYGIWAGYAYSSRLTNNDIAIYAEKTILGEEGIVIIGTTKDNGSGARLQVNGQISIDVNSNGWYAEYLQYANKGVKTFQIGAHGNNTEFSWGYIGTAYNEAWIKFTKGDTTINGDLHVKGNIIADGEVSAGGAGEEGGGSSSGGGGAFYSESIAVGATQTTIAHGLGTDDIVVSIYEKDGVSGRWSIILTDVEIVDANNIIVSFGSATNVEHKVVIMGAVA